MTLYKWDNNGALTWADEKVLGYSDLNGSIQSVFIPIGGVVAWLKSLTGTPATLPEGWVECNGQSLSDANSPLNGETIPDLNGSSGNQRFLRGGTASGSTGGANSHNHTLPTNNLSGGAKSTYGEVTSSNSHLPEYYEVVWIMRVK